MLPDMHHHHGLSDQLWLSAVYNLHSLSDRHAHI